MALGTAKKPERKTGRYKILIYGQWGTGKTTAALQFPKPYLFDTECGADKNKYIDLLEKSDGLVKETANYADILEDAIQLYSTKHDRKTLIIDSLTTVYHNLCDKCADDLLEKGKETNKDETYTGSEFSKHKVIPDRRMRRLLDWIVRLDMNVIVICQEKTKWKKEGKELIDQGLIPDCYDKTPHSFDVIMHFTTRGNSKYVTVKKSRIDEFKENESFELKENNNELMKRINFEEANKESTPIRLASIEQVDEILHLIDVMKIPEDKQRETLDRHRAESWIEMPFDEMQKIIKTLNNRLTNKKAA